MQHSPHQMTPLTDSRPNLLELLAPAKNLDQGREAINHGADAVYIGAPAFGARVAAGNSIEEIEQLARYAHLYHAKVFATVNTLLFDDEVEAAVKLIHQLYNAGVDAAIIQDLGLLECDLPPIELHASTQTHNASSERVKFMEQVGFSRVILARETSLEQMREIRRETHVDLEAFVQGALCVSYSGQCYMSQYLNGRSGNRGCCAQPCRSSYDLCDEHGNLLRKSEHLLSLKDFSAAHHLREMIAAGITSFKIEGRLKDMSYVKNVTAYYRRLLDNIMASDSSLVPASSGHCEFYFMPDLEKTFNRGFTDYFLQGRAPMATLSTQKSIGKRLGKVTNIEGNRVTLKTSEPFASGDGLCFFTPKNELEGFFVNQVQGSTFQPNRMPQTLAVGTMLWRNNDQAFEKQLQGISAQRKIAVAITLTEAEDGFAMSLVDEDGCEASATIACSKELAQNRERALENIDRQSRKLGDTPFLASEVRYSCAQPYFIPASLLNELRRKAAATLENMRIETHISQRGQRLKGDAAAPYFETKIDYRANILNSRAEQFYRRHGVEELEYGVEKELDYRDKALMTTKYCLRYELGACLMGKNSPKGHHDAIPAGTLYLRNNKNLFRLECDCKECLMRIYLAKSESKKKQG